MSKAEEEQQVIGRNHSYRHSLQPQKSVEGPVLRHTQSQNYDAKKRTKTKMVKVPPIPEEGKGTIRESDGAKVKVEVVNETVKGRVSQNEGKIKVVKNSQTDGKVKVNEAVKMRNSQEGGKLKTRSRHSSLSSRGLDNAGFEMEEGKVSRGNSAASSIRSSRNPSVQSMTVVREQYCCYAKWTPCERALFAAVCVLAFIVLILVIVVVLIAVRDEDNGTSTKTKSQSFFSYLDSLKT